MTRCLRASFLRLALACFASITFACCADTLIGFNLIGTNSLDSGYARGPGIAAFETIGAPQGAASLSQTRLTAIEWIQPTNTILHSVAAVFFGSQNVENNLTPVNLGSLPAEVICDVWTNGLAGMSANPRQPSLEFDAGSAVNLLPLGTITNSGNNTVYPIYLARAEVGNSTNFPLTSGSKYAVSMRLRYDTTTNVTTRICSSANTNGIGGLAHGLKSGYWDTVTETNNQPLLLPALAVNFTPVSPPPLTLQLIPPAQFRLSVTNVTAPYTFVRFESATNLKGPIDWNPIPGFGTPPSTTGSLSGQQMFFRAVLK